MYYRTETVADGEQLSLGPGVEQEIVSLAYNHFRMHHSRFFRALFDNKCSIASSMPMRSAYLVSPERLKEVKVLGAMTALMLVYGKLPDPLSTVALQFFLHKCDIRSVTKDFLAEWCPELHLTLTRWLLVGPDDSIAPFRSHFLSYMDTDVSVYLCSSPVSPTHRLAYIDRDTLSSDRALPWCLRHRDALPVHHWA